MAAPTTTIEIADPVRRPRRGAAWGELLTLAAAASCVALSLVVIGPRLLRGATVSESTSPKLESFVQQHTLLEAVLGEASSILSVHCGDEQALELDTLVLWVSDDRYPGQPNLSELLVIRFSPVLRSMLAYTWTPGPDEDAILSDADLASRRRLVELANRPDAIRAVVAQPVTSCEVTGIRTAQTLRPDTSEGPLSLRLTWFDESTDTRDVSTIQTDLYLHAYSNRF